MKIKCSEKKLNNKGFSLLELIIVIAVMVILVGAVFASSSILDSSNARDAESGIKDYIGMARSKSMSVAAKEWFVTITKEDGMYMARLCKTVEEGSDEVTSVFEERELGSKVTIKFGSKESMTVIDQDKELSMYFNSSTGKIDKVLVDGIDEKSGGIGYIGITSGTYEITMKVFYNTGKCERE